MVVILEDTTKAEIVFRGWQETLIWSCLQNVMGAICVDSAEYPRSALAVLGDFYFMAGTPNEELVGYIPPEQNPEIAIMIPQNDGWAELIEEQYGNKATRVKRYAIKKEPDVFDRTRLEEVVASLGSEYSLKMIEEEIFHLCRSEGWSRDLVSQYEDYKKYQKLGIGVAILKNDVLVAGASAYARYREGIEIEIDTKEEYRRRGLASVCGAKLIIECMNQGLYPSWDAQNLGSVALAEKLGYHFDHEYVAYEVLR